MPSFTVDTHVFRELGELLVGRDSTALVELIKNSYDADATDVIVYGDKLDDINNGTIVVTDDGVGMDSRTFSEGFLRIASRTKDTGSRRSAKFKRRYTGAKGIGRLAAHKLARVLEVQSISGHARTVTAIEARIDWDLIEEKETLDEVEDSAAIALKSLKPETTAKSGTRITLRRLRRKWTRNEHSRFLEEIQGFSPPAPLTEALSSNIVKKPLLFRCPKFRDAKTESRFSVRLEGDLAPPDDYWIAALEAAHWVVEIDAVMQPGTVRYCIAPTQNALKELGDVRDYKFQLPHPEGGAGLKFQARILLRTGAATGNQSIRAWSGRSSGVRVYMEGFRVLPYGESHNDWLGLDRDATERTGDLLSNSIEALLTPALPISSNDRPGLLHLPNKHYFGAVFLTQRDAPNLRMLVNREGFVPDGQYDQLVELVRTGIDLTTRVRAVATAGARQARREQRAKPKSAALAAGTDQPSFVAVLADAERHASAARRFTSAGNAEAAGRQLDVALERIKYVALASDDLADQAAMLRVLASVGTQLSSFVHELNGVLGMTESIEGALRRLIDESTDLKRGTRARLNDVARSLGDLRRHVERQASYLIDVVSVDARRRRSRQRLYTRFESASRLIRTAAEVRGVKISNEISLDARSPPMFAAELTTVFANLLSNAVKAAGKNGRIRATGSEDGVSSVVRLENTGKAVNLRTSERWFKPFESSTAEIDPILGQGMGLGLTITRSMLDEYGAKIRFVKPSRGFSTAVEISFNG
jgi:signal transduction histidine kinase